MTERFTILYETEENPMEWDLIDNQEDCLIVTGNGKAICDLLNELNNEVKSQSLVIKGYQERTEKLFNENEQLKQVLGSILIEVKQEISAPHKVGEIRAFINPNSFDLISDVLRKYGALKGWYDD